jgi:hypothetical protein
MRQSWVGLTRRRFNSNHGGMPHECLCRPVILERGKAPQIRNIR